MYSINHIGMAVPDIATYLARNALIFADFVFSSVIVNETQGVREVFFTDGKTTVELLEPLSPSSPIHSFLLQHPTGGLIHICYDCDDIVTTIKELQEQSKARLISGPTPDVAFEGRPIAFLFLAGQIVELVQR
jgi:methylmalonyl-CoA epimerase